MRTAVFGLVAVAACGGGGAGESADGPGAVDGHAADAPRGDGPELIDAGPTTSVSWNAAGGQTPEDACVPFTLTNSLVGGAPPVTLTGGALEFASEMPADLVYYAHETEVLTFERPITVKATLQVDASSSDRDSRAYGGIGVRLGGADRDVILQIGVGTVSLVASAAAPPLSVAAVPTSDAMHTYRITVQPDTYAVEVFYDGTSILAGQAEPSGANVEDRIYWGDISGYASGRMRWESVSHDALLTPVICR